VSETVLGDSIKIVGGATITRVVFIDSDHIYYRLSRIVRENGLWRILSTEVDLLSPLIGIG